MHKRFFYRVYMTQSVNSAAVMTTQPSSLGEILALVMRCVCVFVRRYLHDCTLGKGEVLHQDIQTSVLIIEELPDPPVTQGKWKREVLAGHPYPSDPLGVDLPTNGKIDKEMERIRRPL